MKASESAGILKKAIEKAIADHQITRQEYDSIIHEATKDSFIDNEERALLSQLQDLIENKTVKLIP
ncbi:MAG: hypothetical protein GXO79_04840 [Chlorobi bacterium]|nr:hypothetical protein [Chlorobiota bacterium]